MRATAAAGTRIVPAPLHAPDQRWRVDLPTLTTAAPADIDVDVVTSSVAIERIELEPTAMALRVGADDYALRTGSIELQSIGVTPSAGTEAALTFFFPKCACQINSRSNH